MFTRRDLLKGFIGASAVAILSACAPKTETTAKEGTAAEKDAAGPAAKVKSKIVMWHQWGDTFAMKEMVEDIFNSTIGEEKGIEAKIEFVAQTGGTQASEKFMTAIVGGTPPDCYWFDRFLTAAWAGQNLFMPLDDYMEASNWDRDDFIPLAISEGTLCGKMYSLAIFTDCTQFYWRKDHFREAGLDPDKPPQNRDEMDEFAEILTKKRSDGSYERLGLIPRGIHYGWAYTYLGTPLKPLGQNFWNFETNKAACDDPRIVECVKWMKSYSEKYDVEMVDAFRSGFGGNETDPFGLGLVSMQRNGDWMLSTYDRYFPDLEFGTARIPIPEGLSESACGGGWAMVIPVGSPHPDESWELSSYITSKEGMEYYCKNKKQLPVRKSVLALPFNVEDPRHIPWVETTPNLWNRPAIPAGQVLWTEINTAEDQIIHNQMSVEDALAEVNKKVDAAMAAFDCSMLK
jgi:multiple sugar transport system substrate-binding protein